MSVGPLPLWQRAHAYSGRHPKDHGLRAVIGDPLVARGPWSTRAGIARGRGLRAGGISS